MKNLLILTVIILLLFTVTVCAMYYALSFIWFHELPFDSLINNVKKYNLNDRSIIVIDPLITANAYSAHGFYDYYTKKCDNACLTIQLNQTVSYSYTSSKNALELFKRMKIPTIDDYRLSLNPALLDGFDTVVVLHSEYVTQELFDKLQEHRQVLYMYPNALYGKVIIDQNKITLVRGHGLETSNGFDWKYDNTVLFELDDKCDSVRWLKIKNGYQLNCYPDDVIFDHPEIFDLPNS